MLLGQRARASSDAHTCGMSVARNALVFARTSVKTLILLNLMIACGLPAAPVESAQPRTLPRRSSAAPLPLESTQGLGETCAAEYTECSGAFADPFEPSVDDRMSLHLVSSPSLGQSNFNELPPASIRRLSNEQLLREVSRGGDPSWSPRLWLGECVLARRARIDAALRLVLSQRLSRSACDSVAAVAFTSIGDEALLTVVTEATRPPVTPGRLRAIETLACFSEKAIAPLQATLASDDRRVRAHAALAIGSMAAPVDGLMVGLRAAFAKADAPWELAAMGWALAAHGDADTVDRALSRRTGPTQFPLYLPTVPQLRQWASWRYALIRSRGPWWGINDNGSFRVRAPRIADVALEWQRAEDDAPEVLFSLSVHQDALMLSDKPLPKPTWRLLEPPNASRSFFMIRAAGQTFRIRVGPAIERETDEWVLYKNIVERKTDKTWSAIGVYEGAGCRIFVDVDADGVPEMVCPVDYEASEVVKFWPNVRVLGQVRGGF